MLCWPLQFFLTCSAGRNLFHPARDHGELFAHHRIGLLVPIAVVVSLGVMLWANPKGKEKLAFLASSVYIASMLVGAAFALYPVVLPARDHQSRSDHLTTRRWQPRAQRRNLIWWTLGAVLAPDTSFSCIACSGGKWNSEKDIIKDRES